MSESKHKTPRQTAAGPGPRMFRPGPGLLNVGDLAAEKDGRLVSAAAWEGTRAEFAAAFRGVSDSHHDPERPSRQGPFPPPVVAIPGGAWEFEVRGAAAEGATLGPVLQDGKLLAQVLEAVPAAEAVAVMGGDGTVRVYVQPGKAPAPAEVPDADDGSDE